MLGCQDFCGYYDWTFAHVRQGWGQAAVAHLWAQAIGVDSQQHYAVAGQRSGLRGLYDTWTRTGQDEHCDWTFTLDEARNVLRWDMRECPSKGFLLANQLHADEDYCDHCMGWMVPLLEPLGAEVVEHEHNHCGQCWGVMRMKNRPIEPVEVKCDVRHDRRWDRGFLDRWVSSRKQPLVPRCSTSADAAEVIGQWMAAAGRVVLVDDPLQVENLPAQLHQAAAGEPGSVGLLIGAHAYCHPALPAHGPAAVVVRCEAECLEAVARRFRATPPERRPLLLYAFFPEDAPLDFVSVGLPRPVTLLPLLIRQGVYRHGPGQPLPSTRALLSLLAQALGKEVCNDGR